MSDMAKFLSEVENTIAIYEETIGHAAARTRPMVERYGAVEALSRLMVSADLQKGFKALRDSNRLDRSFEALVVRFESLFKPSVVDAARWRLAQPYELF